MCPAAKTIEISVHTFFLDFSSFLKDYTDSFSVHHVSAHRIFSTRLEHQYSLYPSLTPKDSNFNTWTSLGFDEILYKCFLINLLSWHLHIFVETLLWFILQVLNTPLSYLLNRLFLFLLLLFRRGLRLSKCHIYSKTKENDIYTTIVSSESIQFLNLYRASRSVIFFWFGVTFYFTYT
jgi:hypothetical protein